MIGERGVGAESVDAGLGRKQQRARGVVMQRRPDGGYQTLWCETAAWRFKRL